MKRPANKRVAKAGSGAQKEGADEKQSSRDKQTRQALEKELKESRALLAATFEASRDGILVEYRETIVYANRSLARLHGFDSPEELIGKHVSFLLSPGDSERMLGFGKQRLKGEYTPAVYEFKGKRKDGSLIDLEASVSTASIRGKTCITAVVRDIVERKMAEAELRESEARFRAVAETAACAIFIYQGTRFQYVNASTEIITGYSREELLAMNFWDVIHPDFRALVKQRGLARQRGEQVPSRYEAKIITKSGEERWLYLTAAPFELAGKPAALGTALDITERKQAEEGLLDNQARLSLLSAISMGMTSGMSVEEVIRHTLDRISRFFPDLWVAYGTLAHHGQWIIIDSVEPSGMSSLTGAAGQLAAPDQLKALRLRQPIIIQDIIADTGFNPLAGIERVQGVRATLAVPILQPDDLIGLLCFCSPEPHQWRGHEIATLTEISDYLSIAISDAHAQQEHRRAQEALRKSEASLSEAQRIAHLGNWVLDVKTDELTWSDETYRIFGFAPREVPVTNELFFSCVHPEDREMVIGKVQKALADNELYSIDHRLVLRNGEQRIVHERAEVICDETGQPVRMIGTVQDITERKRAEQELERLHRQNQLILNAAGGGIYGLDAEGRTTFVNPAAARMLGWKVEELIGKSMHDILHHSKPDGTPYPREECPIYAVFSDGVACRVDHEVFWRKDGNSFPVEYISTPIRDEQGNVTGAVVAFNDITERKRAEEALRNSEERYRLLFEGNPQPMWVYDVETLSFLAVNDAALRHYGYSCDEFLAMTIRDIHPPEEVPILLNTIKTLRERNMPGTRKHRKKDGAIIDVEVTSHGLTFDGRKARLVLANDVTERLREEAHRKRAEEELSKSQQNYKALVNSLEGIVWEADAQTFQFTFVSRQAERLLGYPVERWVSDPNFWKNHIHPEDRERAVDYCRRRAAEKHEYQFEYRMMAADGHPMWLRDIVTVVVENDQPVKLRGVMVDITERKQAEKELNMLAQAVRSISDCVSITDMEDNILFVNSAFLTTYGYEDVELLGKNITIVRSPDNPPEVTREILPATLRGGWQGELLNRRKDGADFPISLSTSIVRDEHGQPRALIGVARDISERKLLEEKLRQAQKMEAVGRLAGGIAHDFNNLLTAILGYNDLLLGQVPPDHPLRRDLEEIGKAGLRASSLTRQLLAYSRRQVLQPELLELNTVVANMHKMLRRVIGEDIELVTLLEAGLDLVTADRGQIEQVILNLVINARDAMPRGGKLTIETRNVELDEVYARQHPSILPGNYVMLAVSDNGVGMDAETTTQIFEPFFTTKEIGKGTGLGLSTVDGIVKQSGGDISVYSEPSVGTTFRIYLPRAQSIPEKNSARAVQMEPTGGLETILLVEDEDAVRHLARDVLKKNGYTVLEARDGEEALKISETHSGPIRLILTDMVMPGINGQEVVSRVVSHRPGTKVLYMSGYTDAIINHGLLNPGSDFLSKPFTADTLNRKIRQVLDGP